MRIACLQFAPQVGDVDKNLTRADAVLNRADPKNLDLLVLPELAFSGYNFKSLRHISPFLEPTAAGISSLWARTRALQYDCVVMVGYPEKVGVFPTTPTTPEYYNSVILSNEDGETIANYRSPFTFYGKEKCAIEGVDEFCNPAIEGLGNVAVGTSMDIFPRFEAARSAREFACHILHMQANLAVISMSWQTRESDSSYSQIPKDPDMKALSFWLARLEPIIRAEAEDEIIIVLANRTGKEDNAVYSGTSAVLGIQSGEVKVYGILGRGEEELLVVDTSERPQVKLVSVALPTTSNAGTAKSDMLTVTSDESRTWTSIFTENSDLSLSTQATASDYKEDTIGDKIHSPPLARVAAPKRARSLPYIVAEDEIEKEDVQSDMSVESCGGTISSGQPLADQDLKETAQSVILQILGQDEVLNPLFKEALDKFGSARVVKNLARFIKGYCRLLSRAQPTPDQKKGVAFLRNQARQFAALICIELDPLKLAHDLERSKSCSAEKKARLARWVSGVSPSSSPVRSNTKSDDEDGSETDSLSISDGLPPILEDIRELMVLGEPLKLFRQHFARFTRGESIKEWNNLIKRDHDLMARPKNKTLQTENQLLHSASTSFVDVQPDTITLHQDKKSFRVFWRCRCNRRFEARIPGTDRRVAEKFLQKMDWNVQRDGPMVKHYFTLKWLEGLIWTLAPSLLGRFTWESSTLSANSSDLEAGGGSSFGSTVSGFSARSSERSSGGSEGPEQEMDIATRPIRSMNRTTNPVYICLYKRKRGFWRLRHAKLRMPNTKDQSRIAARGNNIEFPIYSPNMSKVLFLALREKLMRKSLSRTSKREWSACDRSWKSKIKGCFGKSAHWLLRLFNPVSVSGLEFWEFKLNPAPKLVDPIQKDKLPNEEAPSQSKSRVISTNLQITDEWEYSALTGQELDNFKGLIGDLPIWIGLPKKIRTKLVNHDKAQKAGWGFQVEYEWNVVAFVAMTCPIIILGFLIAVFLSIKYQWPISAGVTLALAPLTLVTFINTTLGGITKQKGLTK